jgi:Ca-activated chloride channel family protein
MNALTSFLGSLEQPVWLVAAAVLPLVVAALLMLRDRDRRRRLARLGQPETVQRILPRPARASTGGRIALLAGVTACAGIAWSGPRWGLEQTSIRTAGADVAIAVDASLSMLATDDRPSRLERAKEDVRRLRALAPGDRTALIAFAGRSYTLTPLTVDDGAIALYLDNLDPSVVGQPGTSLARAITQGSELLLASPTTSDRALVIMSDGEGFESEDDVRAAAAKAGDNGISLITVGYGTEEGSTIPLRTPNGVTLKRDDAGAVVVTRYSPVLLAVAAEAAHGTFIPASTTDKAANIRRALAKLRVVRRAVQASDQRSPRFQLFVLPALLLLIADTLLTESRAAPRNASGVGSAARRQKVGARRRGDPRVASGVAAMVAIAGLLPRSLPGPPPESTKVVAVDRAAVYRRAIDRGDHSPRTLYNYGTELLAADSMESAISVLTRSVDARDPDVRYRSSFNLGFAHLKRGLASAGDSGASELDAALDAYKRVLLANPRDPDARWNYELALRKRKGGGGGGGGGAGSGGGGSASPEPQAGESGNRGARPGALGQHQAAEVLNNAAREERDVQGKMQRQSQTDLPPGGKDW